MLQSILRMPKVIAASGYARSTVYLRIEQRLWPRPIKLGKRAMGFTENEVAEMNAARIAGKTDDEIRVLVLRLEAARKALA